MTFNRTTAKCGSVLRVMKYQQLCKRIFSVDKRIRYVTVTDSECKVLAGGMRPGVAPLEHSAKEAEKIDLQVTILDGVMQTWAESLGRARFALIRHERAYMLIVPYDNNHLELSIDASMPIEQIGGMVASIEDVLRQQPEETHDR
jgi:hypothetical protein